MSDSPLRFGGSYFGEAFSDPAPLIADAKHLLSSVDFDTMIGTGLSGSLVVPLLARAMEKHWAIVRKDNDGSHSSNKIEGCVGNRWIFVDDFIDTGATRKRVLRAVEIVTVCHNDSRNDKFVVTHVGTYCYSWAKFIPASSYL